MIFIKTMVIPILLVTANLLVWAKTEAPAEGKYFDSANIILRHIAASLFAIAIGIIFIK